MKYMRIQQDSGCTSWDLNRNARQKGVYFDGHERDDVIAREKYLSILETQTRKIR